MKHRNQPSPRTDQPCSWVKPRTVCTARKISRDAFTTALKLNVENKIAMHSLLDLSYQRSEFYQIEIAMKRYLEFYPDNVDILFGLAGIQYKSNQFEDAHTTLSLLLELNPNHNDANTMIKKIDVKREKVC